jgi:hypothetical protein
MVKSIPRKKQITIVREAFLKPNLKGIVKKKRKGTGRKVTASLKRSLTSPAAHLAMSIIDPWERGACIPDGSTGIGCFFVRGVSTLACGTGTAVCAVLQPDPTNLIYLDTGSSSAVFTLTGASTWASASGLSTISNIYKRWRPVSMGLRAHYVGSTMNDQGSIIVAQTSGSNTAAALNTGGDNLVLQNAMWTKTGPLRGGMSITWRPEDPEDYQFNQFQGVNQTLNSINLAQVPFLFVGVLGAASGGATVRLEWIVNYEGEYLNQQLGLGGMGIVDSDRPIEVGWFEKAASLYRTVSPMGSIISSAVQTFDSVTAPAIQGLTKAMIHNITGNGRIRGG